MPPEVETHLVNAVLTNGARYYVDHAHPELSTPECADPRSIVVYDRAAELILHRSMAAATALLPAGQEIVVYKNNSDRKGNSYGSHENYLHGPGRCRSRKIVNHVMPHFITRQIFTGAGKVGTEAPGLTSADVPYQLTQRADFFEEEVGLETTLKRPIVNTRDEPHADAQKYRRLHVIVGDANLSEVATFLKVGTTAHRAGDDRGRLPRRATCSRPSRCRRCGRSPTTSPSPCRSSSPTAPRSPPSRSSGSCSTGPASSPTSRASSASAARTSARGAAPLGAGAHRPRDGPVDAWPDQVDWVAKHRLLDGYRERHDLRWDDARLAAMDLQYHDLRPEKSLAARVGLERIATDAEMQRGR